MSAPRINEGERNWRARAACRDVDPELFFPEPSNEPIVQAQVAAAKAVCQPCPVREQCLADALERLPYGIAGGFTEQERRRSRATGATTGRRARWLVLFEAGWSHHEIAHEYGVSVRTIERWITQHRRAERCTTNAGGDSR